MFLWRFQLNYKVDIIID